MIIDASVMIDAVTDAGPRGAVARRALADLPADEPLVAPGHHAVEVLAGLRRVFRRTDLAAQADALLVQAERLGVRIEATPWSDVRRAWQLSLASLSLADAVYVAAAERHRTTLLTADQRISRSGADIACEVRTLD